MIQMTPGKKKKKDAVKNCANTHKSSLRPFFFFFLYRYTTQRDLEEGDGQSYLQSLLLEWSWSSTFGVGFFFFFTTASIWLRAHLVIRVMFKVAANVSTVYTKVKRNRGRIRVMQEIRFALKLRLY